MTLALIHDWRTLLVRRTVPIGAVIGLATIMDACGSGTATVDASVQGADVYASLSEGPSPMITGIAVL
jgi:hypothetical protein